jgi:hypothetical protein
MASYNLCTVDLAWFASLGATVRRTLSLDRAAEYYRQRLECYLGHCFEPATWQAMLELGFLFDALRVGCLIAFFSVRNDNETDRAWRRAQVMGLNNQIRAGAKWL